LSRSLPSTNGNSSDSLLQLKSVFTQIFGGEGQLHIDQERAILGLVDHGHRLMLIQSAGYGKSLVHFLAANLIKQRTGKMTLVVVPLVALAWSQKTVAEKCRLKAVVMDASTTRNEKRDEIENCVLDGDTGVVLTTPEQLSNKFFREKGVSSKVGLVVIDECHCIREWGNDFRSSYLRLRDFVSGLRSDVPVVASTATVNSIAEEEIRRTLSIMEPTIRGTLRLSNVILRIIGCNFKQLEALAWLRQNGPQLCSSGPGIIYCCRTRDCETIAFLLRSRGVKAEAYHNTVQRDHVLFANASSSDNSAYRRELEGRFAANEIQVLVATTALGMGFDKRDLYFVILYDPPLSSAAIYQQIGRAGRSTDKDAMAYILFDNYGKNGNNLKPSHCWRQTGRLKDNLCTGDEVKELLGIVKQSDSRGVTVDLLCQKVNYDKSKIENTLKYLESINPPMVRRSIGDMIRWLLIENNCTNHTEYAMTRQAHLEKKEEEWKRVVFPFLVRRKVCKMYELTKALGDESVYECKKCSFCENFHNQLSLPKSELDLLANELKQLSEKRLSVRRDLSFNTFQDYKLSPDILSDAVEGRVMTHWSDEGWGEILRRCYESSTPPSMNPETDKDDLLKLAEGAAALYRRWKPEPKPKWITFIPSIRHPTLSYLCKKFAGDVGLVFIEAISFNLNPEKRPKSRSIQKNDYHRCRNVDGCYAVDETKILQDPVILFDYVVISGCTITTVAALLKQKGSGPVIPFAIAKKDQY
jgi:ATP-dependent DNA helicase RecQ